MKILIVQDHLRSGGTERQSVLLANAFAAAGHATHLLTFRPGGALDGSVAPNVGRSALQPIDLRLDWFAPGLKSTVRRFGPDVVLCMGRMANCRAGTIQRLQPAAVVVATMRTGKPLPRTFQHSLLAVRHVVANSDEARATLVGRYRVPAASVTTIHNALVFPERAADRNEALRRANGAAPGTLVLLCVAMFRPEKNQRELVDLAAALSPGLDWQLWLAGDGPARPACERRARARGVQDRVRFLGFHRDPSPLYAAADVAVHASHSESLSNFLIEAQAHGLPVVAYEAQGVRESFVPDRTGWLIARDDRAAFRRALVRLAEAAPAERATRSAAARTYARTTFDPVRQVGAYLTLFEELRPRP